MTPESKRHMNTDPATPLGSPDPPAKPSPGAPKPCAKAALGARMPVVKAGPQSTSPLSVRAATPQNPQLTAPNRSYPQLTAANRSSRSFDFGIFSFRWWTGDAPKSQLFALIRSYAQLIAAIRSSPHSHSTAPPFEFSSGPRRHANSTKFDLSSTKFD